MADCKTCKETRAKKAPESVPYLVHEQAMVRNERTLKRLIIALIVSIALMFASNIGWLVYEGQFETFCYEQDGEGINNVNFGDQGDLNNGAEDQVQEEESKESTGE